MNNREILCDAGYEETLLFDGPEFDVAIIGVTYEGQAVYDFEKMVQHHMETYGSSRTEAIEDIEYNTIGSLPSAGEEAPVIMYMLDDL